MYLFKASGATYRRVIKQTIHAFQYRPADVRGDEFVLLAKNREDCDMLEKQVQNVAKLLRVRSATASELERLFPGVGASDRWTHVVELYWMRPLVVPFNLSDAPGFDAQRYAPVQGFAKLHAADEQALFDHLAKTNEQLVLDFVNNAHRP